MIVSAPADYTIQIDYTYPKTYVAGGRNINVATNKIYFEATCALEDGTGTVLKGYKLYRIFFDLDIV